MNEIIYYDIPEKVRIRKYKCNILEFQKFLKNHKNITNKKLSNLINRPLTEVEHWFRTDKYFSYPDEKNMV